MLKFVKGCLEIFGNGDVKGECGIVLENGESSEEGTVPTNGDGIKRLEDLDEVVGVFLADILDHKVIDDKGENYGLCGVLLERRSSGNSGKSKVGKVSFEPVIGNADGLFEDGHAFLDLEVYSAVRTERAEVVLVDYFFRGCRPVRVLCTHSGP